MGIYMSRCGGKYLSAIANENILDYYSSFYFLTKDIYNYLREEFIDN
jgi:hypothetical protein